MSFSNSQIQQLCEVLEMDSIMFEDHLRYFATWITAEKQTRIEALLVRWEVVEPKYTKTKPLAENFGGDYDPEREKRDIRSKLESLLLLNRAAWYSNSNSDSIYLERG